MTYFHVLVLHLRLELRRERTVQGRHCHMTHSTPLGRRAQMRCWSRTNVPYVEGQNWNRRVQSQPSGHAVWAIRCDWTLSSSTSALQLVQSLAEVAFSEPKLEKFVGRVRWSSCIALNFVWGRCGSAGLGFIWQPICSYVAFISCAPCTVRTKFTCVQSLTIHFQFPSRRLLLK